MALIEPEPGPSILLKHAKELRSRAKPEKQCATIGRCPARRPGRCAARWCLISLPHPRCLKIASVCHTRARPRPPVEGIQTQKASPNPCLRKLDAWRPSAPGLFVWGRFTPCTRFAFSRPSSVSALARSRHWRWSAGSCCA